MGLQISYTDTATGTPHPEAYVRLDRTQAGSKRTNDPNTGEFVIERGEPQGEFAIFHDLAARQEAKNPVGAINVRIEGGDPEGNLSAQAWVEVKKLHPDGIDVV